MVTIISKRHFFKFYITILLLALFFGLLSLATGVLYDQGSTFFGKIIMIAVSAGLAFMVFYTISQYYKNAPRIVVNDNSISFNSKVYYWRDLEKIEMTGKRSFKFMGERKEGASLKFIGKKERFIFDDMYKNAPEIKMLIELVTNRKTVSADVMDNDVGETLDNTKWFKGFPLFSFDGIVFGGLILFFLSAGIITFLSHKYASAIIGPGILSLLVFILISYRWYYFGISGGVLVIKNYNFPWIRKDYRLGDIKEIIFEETGGRATLTRMRIIMNDFSTKKYPAATLSSKKWLQLKTDLERKGVKVRNECVYYEPFKFKFFND